MRRLSRLLLALALAACDLEAEAERDSAPVATLHEGVADDACSTTVRADTPNGEASGRPGVVLSREEIEIRPPAAARIMEISVRAGDLVAPGDVIARLDATDAVTDLRIAKADLRALQGERRALQLSLDAAERRRSKTEALRAEGFVSEHEADATSLEADEARAAVAQVDARRRGIEARIEQVRAILDDQWLRSPIAGVVAALPVAAGERIEPGSVVARLLTAEAMRVRFAIAPAARATFAPGRGVTVRSPELAAPLRATVVSVSPEVDPAADLVFVDAALDDATLSLTVGLGVAVDPQ